MEQYEGALSAYTEALAIRVNIRLRDHRSVVDSNNNIGFVCFNMEKYPDALSHFEEALKIYERLFQPIIRHWLLSTIISVSCMIKLRNILKLDSSIKKRCVFDRKHFLGIILTSWAFVKVFAQRTRNCWENKCSSSIDMIGFYSGRNGTNFP